MIILPANNIHLRDFKFKSAAPIVNNMADCMPTGDIAIEIDATLSIAVRSLSLPKPTEKEKTDKPE